jgi:uncharacterized protein
VNSPGILLDTGPLVALLSQADTHHDRARELFSACRPPFRCCEPVLAEACVLMRKVDPAGPAEVLALGRRGLFAVAISVAAQSAGIEALLLKYADQPISLADATLIRCAEVHRESRVLTFDAHFGLYRWARNRRFDVIG